MSSLVETTVEPCFAAPAQQLLLTERGTNVVGPSSSSSEKTRKGLEVTMEGAFAGITATGTLEIAMDGTVQRVRRDATAAAYHGHASLQHLQHLPARLPARRLALPLGLWIDTQATVACAIPGQSPMTSLLCREAWRVISLSFRLGLSVMGVLGVGTGGCRELLFLP